MLALQRYIYTFKLFIKYVLFISHNTTSFIRYLFKLTTISAYIFRPSTVHKNVCLEEVIQVSHKIKYVELKFNEISLTFIFINSNHIQYFKMLRYHKNI